MVIKNICKEKLWKIKVFFTEVYKKTPALISEVTLGKFISVIRCSLA